VAIPDQRRTAPRYLRRLHGLVHARFALHRIRDTQRNEGQAPVGRVHGPSRAPFGSASCNISISPTVSEVTRQEWPKSLKDRAATPQKNREPIKNSSVFLCRIRATASCGPRGSAYRRIQKRPAPGTIT
jgi:hypothetical protein